MTRPPMSPRGWSFGWNTPDEPPRDPAPAWSPAELARLHAARVRYLHGEWREATPETMRWLFARWAVKRGLYRDY